MSHGTRVMQTEVFGFSNYRDYLSHRIQTTEEGRGYQKQLAIAAKCQSSYLSQVLSGNANLTLEQAFGICHFWDFDKDQTDFYMALVSKERAGTPKLRDYIDAKIEAIRVKKANLSNRFDENQSVNPEQKVEYYSNWYMPVIHTMVAIPRFRQAPAIARQLNLPVETVDYALNQLEKSGLVAKTADGWTNTARDIHLRSDSPLNYHYHNMVRMLANRRMQESTPGESLHYSAVYSLSESDFAKIKQELLTMLENTRLTVLSSPEETAAAFTLDFFRM
ncbi:TIGR02147 family protein [bacterium]|nr:TIGR02147 family protein [bacterium]